MTHRYGCGCAYCRQEAANIVPLAAARDAAYRFTLADLVVDLDGIERDLSYAADEARRRLGNTIADALPHFRREVREAHEALGRMLVRLGETP